MRERGIARAFALDDDFKAAGFATLGQERVVTEKLLDRSSTNSLVS
jgi:hypothetical protein